MPSRNGNHKLVWLHLLKEGGRWSVAEIAAAIRMKPGAVNSCMYRFVLQGMVIRKPTNKKGRAMSDFGVTKQCRIPVGVTIAELEEIGVLRIGDAQPTGDAP